MGTVEAAAADEEDPDSVVAVSHVAHLELRVVGNHDHDHEGAVACVKDKATMHVARPALTRSRPRVSFDALAYVRDGVASAACSATLQGDVDACANPLCASHHADATRMFSSWLEERERVCAGEAAVTFALPLLAFESKRGKRGVLVVELEETGAIAAGTGFFSNALNSAPPPYTLVRCSAHDSRAIFASS